MSLHLRFKLFQSVITSTILYSLETCQLTENLQDNLDIIQRTMMRKMIGWEFVTGATWAIAGRKMKVRLRQYTDQLRIRPWSEQVNERKRKVLANPCEAHHWMYQSMRWHPPCCSGLKFFHCSRSRGHPHTKWYDVIAPTITNVSRNDSVRISSSRYFFNNFELSTDTWW